MRKKEIITKVSAAALACALTATSLGMPTAVWAEEQLISDEEGNGTVYTDEAQDDEDGNVYVVDLGEDDEDTDPNAGQDDEAELIIDDEENEIVTSDGALYDDVLAEEEREEAKRGEWLRLMEEGHLPMENASSTQIETYLEQLLSQENPTGSDGELTIAGYIESTMLKLGYTVEEQSFHEGFLNESYVDVPGVNIIAERGADSVERSQKILLIAGHYDSKTNPEEGDLFANDKSAAAVMLESARLLSALDTDLDVCFLFLSGEEDGSYGSKAFAEHLSDEQKARLAGVICLDTVGTRMAEPYGISFYGEDITPSIAAGAVPEDEEGQNAFLDTIRSEEARTLAERVLKTLHYVKNPGNVSAVALEFGADETEETAQSSSSAPSVGQLGKQGKSTLTSEDLGLDGLTGESAEGESAADGEKTSAVLGTWHSTTDYPGTAQSFAMQQLNTICLFQDVEGKYLQQEEKELREESSEQITEEETEAADTLHLAGAQEQSVYDTEEMAHMADLVAQTVGWYMYEQRLAGMGE